MMMCSWILATVMVLNSSPEKESKTVKLIQSTVMEIGGSSVGLVRIRSRDSKVSGKEIVLAELSVLDRSSKQEQDFLVATGNELVLGTQKVRVKEIRPAASETERGYIVFELLDKT